LPDRYGPVAFPVDYPNEWDARHGRTGSGIWVHGIASDTYSRPPLDSDGCVALTNNELAHIAPNIHPGSTPVVIGYDIPWQNTAEIDARRIGLEASIESWRRAWERGDTDDYLEYYAADFEGRGMDKRGWSDYKRRVNASKTFMRVGLSDVSMFGYPDENDMVVVTFQQRYSSNNFNSTSRKRQYWRLEADGRVRHARREAVDLGGRQYRGNPCRQFQPLCGQYDEDRRTVYRHASPRRCTRIIEKYGTLSDNTASSGSTV